MQWKRIMERINNGYIYNEVQSIKFEVVNAEPVYEIIMTEEQFKVWAEAHDL